MSETRACDREEQHAPHSWGDLEWCPGGVLEIQPDYLTREERWVPITEAGRRWAPRTRAEAEQAMAEVPAGGAWPDTGEPLDGIVRVAREVRYVTEWTEGSGA